ncbi:hypothetical protein HPT25_20175 [Bacillus sp. BRMEA1]|nr:hypothetical protein [Neobacillus endophyticus]NRD79682.1 hypothetical protein [Neobacillus endophyticus]
MTKFAFVTGANKGIGYEIVRQDSFCNLIIKTSNVLNLLSLAEQVRNKNK